MLSRVAAPHSSSATRSVALNEARKRRASERRYVGSCNELCRRSLNVQPESPRRWISVARCLEVRSSLTARRAVSLLLLTMRSIGRGAGDWSSFAGADLLERVRNEPLQPVLQKVDDTGKNQVERFQSGGRETLIVDARLMLAFTSEAPN